MNIDQVHLPIPLWIAASIVGGLIGALNPAFLLLEPSYIEYIQTHFHFNYTNYAVVTGGFFLMVLFIPCTLSTFALYPVLYEMITNSLRTQEKPGFFKILGRGTLFGCMACFGTAFFLTIELLIYGYLHQQPTNFFLAIGAIWGGTVLIGIVGLFFIPMIVVTGYIYTALNYLIIQKFELWKVKGT